MKGNDDMGSMTSPIRESSASPATGDDGIVSSGHTRRGSWETYATAIGAFSAAGFGIAFPPELRDARATDFQIIEDLGRRSLSIGYRQTGAPVTNDGNEELPIIIRKGNQGMPPGTKSETSVNRHHIESGGRILVLCGNGSATTARWQVTDPDSGKRWHYYLEVAGMPSDDEMGRIACQFD